MANGTPLPGWLGSVAQLTTQVGVPTVFAAVLLWFMLTKMSATLEVIEAQESMRTQMLKDIQTSFVAAIQEQTEDFKEALKENARVPREH